MYQPQISKFFVIIFKDIRKGKFILLYIGLYFLYKIYYYYFYFINKKIGSVFKLTLNKILYI